MPEVNRLEPRKGRIASFSTVLVIVLVVFVLAGIGWYYFLP
jgi:hypothetical protein